MLGRRVKRQGHGGLCDNSEADGGCCGRRRRRNAASGWAPSGVLYARAVSERWLLLVFNCTKQLKPASCCFCRNCMLFVLRQQ